MGFVFMLRWLHINLCKWGLWLYFHEASKEETTGLLPMKKPERTKVENMAQSRSSPPSLQRQAFSHRRHYTAQLWKDRFAMQCASVRVCVWIPTLGDEGKSSVAEWRMKSTSQSDKQIVKRLRNENRKRWTEGAQRWRSLFFSSKSWIKPRGKRGVKISQENITTMQSRNQTVLVSKTDTGFWRILLQMLQFRTGAGTEIQLATLKNQKQHCRCLLAPAASDRGVSLWRCVSPRLQISSAVRLLKAFLIFDLVSCAPVEEQLHFSSFP